MLVKEVNDRIESIDNEIKYWLDIKEIKELNDVQIEELDEEFKNIFKDIDSKVDKLYEEKIKLNQIIDEHLRKKDRYDELLQEIIYYKEEVPKKYSWDEIASLVHFSKVYCRKIYSRYKKQRNV